MGGRASKDTLPLFLLTVLLALPACSGDGPAGVPDDDDDPVPGAVVKGLALSPRGWPQDFSDLLAFLGEAGSLPDGGVMQSGPWRGDVEGGSDSGQMPQPASNIAAQAAQYGYTPILVFGWRSGETPFLNVPGNPTNDWTNTEARTLFRQMLVEFVTAHTPPFLFLGNESDFYYARDPGDYARWIGAYNEAYDAVKAASPSTQVGPVFNFEHMAGAGRFVGFQTPYWQALTLHDLARVDIVAVTVYPWFHHAAPAEVPSGYLDPLVSRIGGKPIAITETGWPGEDPTGLNPPWAVSEAARVEYVAKLAQMLEGKSVRIVNWLFLHPMSQPGSLPLDQQLFASISLRDYAGAKRPVYDAWAAFTP